VALTGALFGHGLVFMLSALATVILLYFLLASEHWMLSRCVEAVPRQRARALLLSGVRAAQREIGRYLFALSCINLGVGVVTGLALAALGLANPVLWAVVAMVLNFVPYLGPLITTGLLLLAGVVSFGELPAVLAPAGAYLLIHAIESNFFSPWMVGRRLALSPLAVFLSVMFWGWLWGIAGALIAVPVLIALRSLFWRQRRLRPLARLLEGDFNAPPSLRALLRPKPPSRAAHTHTRPPAAKSTRESS
jgi:predicted PurR-regulated permease PerM